MTIIYRGIPVLKDKQDIPWGQIKRMFSGRTFFEVSIWPSRPETPELDFVSLRELNFMNNRAHRTIDARGAQILDNPEMRALGIEWVPSRERRV